jgi:hypothetical protein
MGSLTFAVNRNVRLRKLFRFRWHRDEADLRFDVWALWEPDHGPPHPHGQFAVPVDAPARSDAETFRDGRRMTRARPANGPIGDRSRVISELGDAAIAPRQFCNGCRSTRQRDRPRTIFPHNLKDSLLAFERFRLELRQRGMAPNS